MCLFALKNTLRCDAQRVRPPLRPVCPPPHLQRAASTTCALGLLSPRPAAGSRRRSKQSLNVWMGMRTVLQGTHRGLPGPGGPRPRGLGPPAQPQLLTCDGRPAARALPREQPPPGGSGGLLPCLCLRGRSCGCICHDASWWEREDHRAVVLSRFPQALRPPTTARSCAWPPTRNHGSRGRSSRTSHTTTLPRDVPAASSAPEGDAETQVTQPSSLGTSSPRTGAAPVAAAAAPLAPPGCMSGRSARRDQKARSGEAAAVCSAVAQAAWSSRATASWRRAQTDAAAARGGRARLTAKR
jgi:hypothetical protein